jgi:3-dehydroquinate synthase
VRTLTVALAERSYPIHVGTDLLARVGDMLPPTRSARAVIITNPTVAAHHLEALHGGLSRAGLSGCDSGFTRAGRLLRGSSRCWGRAAGALGTGALGVGHERRTLLVSLVGGVVGDLAGFAAATYQLGMPLVQLPTTLLAQVDSSVGGKTAVNHPLGKNMIGAFYQPSAVIIDVATLTTLPRREFAAGVAEVIKYGAACDAGLFAWLESALERLLARDADAIAHAIFESCRIKAAIVAADERESGVRALLNFGHTFGHAIEAGTGYGSWLHGEAVAAGMVLATKLSERIAGLPQGDAARITRLIERARLPTQPPSIGFERWIELMSRDKKSEAGKIRFVLLAALGVAVVRADAIPDDLRAVLGK